MIGGCTCFVFLLFVVFFSLFLYVIHQTGFTGIESELKGFVGQPDCIVMANADNLFCIYYECTMPPPCKAQENKDR